MRKTVTQERLDFIEAIYSLTFERDLPWGFRRLEISDYLVKVSQDLEANVTLDISKVDRSKPIETGFKFFGVEYEATDLITITTQMIRTSYLENGSDRDEYIRMMQEIFLFADSQTKECEEARAFLDVLIERVSD